MSHSHVDPQTDPLLTRRHFRLKIVVAGTIGVLCLVAAILLWLSREIHTHLHHQSFQAALLVSFGMWLLMSVAMMLPTAWNMVVTYLDVGFAARQKGMSVPGVSALISGYLTVWSVFSIAAASLQTVLLELDLISHEGWPPALFTGSLFVGVGAFEWTGLKNHCLTQCRNPFNTILSQFRPSWARIYRIGLEQGLYCLGCCWALMMLMFAAGLMNFGWMALLAALMAVQKHQLVPRFEKPLGVGLIITGLALIAFGSA